MVDDLLSHIIFRLDARERSKSKSRRAELSPSGQITNDLHGTTTLGPLNCWKLW